MNKSAETVFVISEALVGVIIKFICENPLSHSLEEMEIVLRACIRGRILSEYTFVPRTPVRVILFFDSLCKDSCFAAVGPSSIQITLEEHHTSDQDPSQIQLMLFSSSTLHMYISHCYFLWDQSLLLQNDLPELHNYSTLQTLHGNLTKPIAYLKPVQFLITLLQVI